MTKADKNKNEQTKDNNNKQTNKQTTKKLSYQVLLSFRMTDQRGLREIGKTTTLFKLDL